MGKTLKLTLKQLKVKIHINYKFDSEILGLVEILKIKTPYGERKFEISDYREEFFENGTQKLLKYILKTLSEQNIKRVKELFIDIQISNGKPAQGELEIETFELLNKKVYHINGKSLILPKSLKLQQRLELLGKHLPENYPKKIIIKRKTLKQITNLSS